jgi:hypothetical protein
MPTKSEASVSLNMNSPQTHPVQEGDLRWWDIVGLGLWHIGIIVLLLVVIVQAWPKIVETVRSPTLTPISQKVTDFTLVDLGDKPVVQSTAKIIASKLREPGNDTVLNALHDGAPKELLKDYTTKEPPENLPQILVGHLNKKLDDRALAAGKSEYEEGA